MKQIIGAVAFLSRGNTLVLPPQAAATLPSPIPKEKSFSVTDSHVGMGLECTSATPVCLPAKLSTEPYHETDAQGKSCGACHNGKTAFTVKASCKNCTNNTT